MARKLKRIHEFRDPLHDFIRLDRQERLLVDSEPFQRLRHIHQLALTYLVYPGASHRRFEHSLGVMHLAGRVFDVVTDPSNVRPEIDHMIPDRKSLPYWRTVLCLAALCHDMGHLPFSHAAEKWLLPKGEDHESLTLSLIGSEHLQEVWRTGFRVEVEDVKKLAVGKKKLADPDTPFDDWEAILSEIIVGDAFGVDRMDYLLRDSYHLGVSYGRFDHLKLIDSLRILPSSVGDLESAEPSLGVEESGVHSAEALLLARFFMFEQVYFHPIRRIYDRHLIEFMATIYGTNGYPIDVEFHLKQTDNEVLSELRARSAEPSSEGYESAHAILHRKHFRMVYSRNPTDESLLEKSIESGAIVPDIDKPISPAYYLNKELVGEVGDDNIRTDLYIQPTNPNLFPVLMADGRIESSVAVSNVLANIPPTVADFIFASPDTADHARSWLKTNRDRILNGERPA